SASHLHTRANGGNRERAKEPRRIDRRFVRTMKCAEHVFGERRLDGLRAMAVEQLDARTCTALPRRDFVKAVELGFRRRDAPCTATRIADADARSLFELRGPRVIPVARGHVAFQMVGILALHLCAENPCGGAR